MTTPAAHEAIVRRLYDEALNQARYDQVVDQVVAAGAVTHDGLGRAAAGPEGVKAFSDMEFVLDDVIANTDRVAVRWHMTGSHTGPFAGHAPTGRLITQHAVVIYRIEAGQVAEIWPLIDRLGLVHQLTN